MPEKFFANEGDLMKKFFLMMIAMFALSSTCLAATPVRVSDYNLNDFFHTYNNVAVNVTKNNWAFGEFPMEAIKSGIYDSYLAACGPYGHGVAVGLFANKQGHISKITLSFNGSDKTTCECSAGVFVNVLATLRMSLQEISNLIQELESKKRYAHYFCSATNRYIVVEVSEDRAHDLINIRITATVN